MSRFGAQNFEVAHRVLEMLSILAQNRYPLWLARFSIIVLVDLLNSKLVVRTGQTSILWAKSVFAMP